MDPKRNLRNGIFILIMLIPLLVLCIMSENRNAWSVVVVIIFLIVALVIMMIEHMVRFVAESKALKNGTQYCAIVVGHTAFLHSVRETMIDTAPAYLIVKYYDNNQVARETYVRTDHNQYKSAVTRFQVGSIVKIVIHNGITLLIEKPDNWGFNTTVPALDEKAVRDAKLHLCPNCQKYVVGLNGLMIFCPFCYTMTSLNEQGNQWLKFALQHGRKIPSRVKIELYSPESESETEKE